MGAPVTIGADVGGTKVLVVAVDHATGLVVGTLRRPTGRGATGLLDGVAAAVQALADELGLGAQTPVAVGIAGLVDRRGVLRHGPNQPGITELDAQGELTARLGRRVRVENDANCALRAELADGAARGATDVVLVTLGTGIGGALAVDGRVVRGANGMAGEPGHAVVDPTGPPCPCGRRGCWERYASGAGLARMARDAAEAGRLEGVLADVGGDPAAIRGEDVVASARGGDEGALAVLGDLAWWTALGVANLVAILDPERVVLGGGLIDDADLWLEEVRRLVPQLLVAADHRDLPEVVAAAHGSAAAAHGAALVAREGA
jgi:glucokinase